MEHKVTTQVHRSKEFADRHHIFFSPLHHIYLQRKKNIYVDAYDKA